MRSLGAFLFAGLCLYLYCTQELSFIKESIVCLAGGIAFGQALVLGTMKENPK